MLAEKIKEIVDEVFLHYAYKILNEARSEFQISEIKSDGSVEDTPEGVLLYYSNKLTAYQEFGTGQFAASYLSDKPNDLKQEAMKFFVNGMGVTMEEPIIYPLVIKYVEEIPKEVDARVEAWFSGLVL